MLRLASAAFEDMLHRLSSAAWLPDGQLKPVLSVRPAATHCMHIKLSLPVESQRLARLQQVCSQVGVLVDAALALCELGQRGHGGHEPARVGLRCGARVAIGVDARARLPVQLLHRLPDTVRVSQQLTPNRSSPLPISRRGPSQQLLRRLSDKREPSGQLTPCLTERNPLRSAPEPAHLTHNLDVAELQLQSSNPY